MDIEKLAQSGDLDGLLRAADDLIDAADWEQVARLGRLSRAAIERGHQLWPAATYVEYRTALDGPGEWAAAVLTPDAGRFALGPLAEVAASHHLWDELAPHLDPGPMRSQFALECVAAGQDLTERGLENTITTDLPLKLQYWESPPPPPVYEPFALHCDPPDTPLLAVVALSAEPSRVLDEPTSTDALRALVTPWVSDSNGRAEALAVEGDRCAALAALGVANPRIGTWDQEAALAALGWAASSGGAHGRRRGRASARFDIWWLLHALMDQCDDWPLSPDELGQMTSELGWYCWDGTEPATPWSLKVVIEDPVENLSWLLHATDSVQVGSRSAW